MRAVHVDDGFLEDDQIFQAPGPDRVEETPQRRDLGALPTQARSNVKGSDPGKVAQEVDAEDSAVESAADQDGGRVVYGSGHRAGPTVLGKPVGYRSDPGPGYSRTGIIPWQREGKG